MRQLLLLCVVVILAGCRPSAAAPSATRVVDGAYQDTAYHFSFRYPLSWHLASKHGTTTSVQGVPTYVVNVNTPNNVEGVRIQVDRHVIPLGTFQEGHVAPDPSGGPDMFHYHHAHVSGWPAMQVQRYNGSKIDGIFTIVNTRTLSFTIEMVTPNPPFSRSALSGYDTILRTIKLPFA